MELHLLLETGCLLVEDSGAKDGGHGGYPKENDGVVIKKKVRNEYS